MSKNRRICNISSTHKNSKHENGELSSGKSKKIRISVLTITKNEEKNLPGMIESIAPLADELVIVDDKSKDNTCRIASEKFSNTIIIKNPMKSQNHGAQRNIGYKKCSGEWILWLDGDERLTPELCDEIKKSVENPKFSGFSIPRINYLPLDGSTTKEYHVRLFRNGYGKNTDGIHSVTQIDGEIGTLNASLMHFPWRGVQHWLEKMVIYAQGDAQRYLDQKRNYRKMTIFMMATMIPIYMFFYWYVIKRHFRHGLGGLIFSIGSSTTWIMKAAILYEKKYVIKNGKR